MGFDPAKFLKHRGQLAATRDIRSLLRKVMVCINLVMSGTNSLSVCPKDSSIKPSTEKYERDFEYLDISEI